MHTKIAEQIKQMTQPFTEQGFVFQSLYEKGGDSSCVYICRYKKGRDFFDWREVSGSNEIHFVVYANGVYDFPTLKKIAPRAYRAFRLKHLFRSANMTEMRRFAADILVQELKSGKSYFLGIPL